MKSILDKYVGQQIGLNISRPFHIESVQLVAIQDSYFTVTLEKDENLHHIPYANLVRTIENPSGVHVGGLFHQKKTYPLIAKIGHIVEYVPG